MIWVTKCLLRFQITVREESSHFTGSQLDFSLQKKLRKIIKHNFKDYKKHVIDPLFIPCKSYIRVNLSL